MSAPFLPVGWGRFDTPSSLINESHPTEQVSNTDDTPGNLRYFMNSNVFLVACGNAAFLSIIINCSNKTKKKKTYFPAKSLLENHSTKSMMASPIPDELAFCPFRRIPFAKLCSMILTRSSRSRLRGHQISVMRLRRAGDNCRERKKH